MATIFLSYRRTDGPQACRVHDWLGQRFGYDAVFMDVAAIPVAVAYPDFLRQAIARSRIVVALIGAQWAAKIDEPGDPVRMELETALERRVTVLPVLVGDTPMPDAEKLPRSIAAIALQNAVTVGVLHDFDTHMRALLPKIESILGALAPTSVGHSDPRLIERACRGIVGYLRTGAQAGDEDVRSVRWEVVGTQSFGSSTNAVTLFLHRVVCLADVVELHVLFSFWAGTPSLEQALAGWLMSRIERGPVVPSTFLEEGMPPGIPAPPRFRLKLRPSDEDARQVWKAITNDS
jgi:hypothetical protein